MRLVCIECGEPIPAGQINVSDLVAVCPACDTVFRFDLDEEKPKHRKIKPPEGLVVHDDASLHLSYEKVFGSEARSSLIGIGFATLMLTFIVITTTGGFLAGDIPLPVPLIMGTMWSMGLYTLAMLYFTRTRIISESGHLRVLHHFPPHPLQAKDVSIELSSIERIYSEESYSSKRRGDAERSYHLYADTYDGGRVLILKGVPENYALYIQQEITRQMHALDESVESRLVEQDEADESLADDEPMQLSQAHEQ